MTRIGTELFKFESQYGVMMVQLSILILEHNATFQEELLRSRRLLGGKRLSLL